jgi:hypothetical protein
VVVPGRGWGAGLVAGCAAAAPARRVAAARPVQSEVQVVFMWRFL